MNILFINSAKNWGGNELWSVGAANALAERGHYVVFAFRSDIFIPKLSPKVIQARMSLKHELDLYTYSVLREIIRDRKIEYVIPTKRKEYFIGGLMAKLFGIKSVFRLGIVREIKRSDLAQQFVYSKLPNAIIVNAKEIKNTLIKCVNIEPNKVKVIYNGYDFPKDYEKGAYIERRDSEEFIFASAGRLSDQKGFDLLLNAVALLKSRNLNFRCVIAGDGSSREEYERYIKENGIEKYFDFIGHSQYVRHLFSQADCIVIPSRNEGVPNALFEAWSLGKPVIASLAAGIPEVIHDGENGYLFDLNPQSIADTIVKSLENRNKLAEFGAIGERRLNEYFTKNRMAGEIEDLLKSL
jgi:glycosyltransferase involved in cell wall biosynthesis